MNGTQTETVRRERAWDARIQLQQHSDALSINVHSNTRLYMHSTLVYSYLIYLFLYCGGHFYVCLLDTMLYSVYAATRHRFSWDWHLSIKCTTACQCYTLSLWIGMYHIFHFLLCTGIVRVSLPTIWLCFVLFALHHHCQATAVLHGQLTSLTIQPLTFTCIRSPFTFTCICSPLTIHLYTYMLTSHHYMYMLLLYNETPILKHK